MLKTKHNFIVLISGEQLHTHLSIFINQRFA